MSNINDHKPASLYERLRAAGIEVSNWQSDLYYPVTAQTTEITQQTMTDGELKTRPERFKSNINGQQMYCATFQFDPYWTARQAPSATPNPHRVPTITDVVENPATGATVRFSKAGASARLTYDESLTGKPWLCFINGECVNHYPTLTAGRDRLVADGFRQLAQTAPGHY